MSTGPFFDSGADTRQTSPRPSLGAVDGAVGAPANPHEALLTFDAIECLEMQWAFEDLVKDAAEKGMVVTVEQVPLQPLAMGNYETRVTVRKARGA